MVSQHPHNSKPRRVLAHSAVMYLGYFSALGAFLPFVSLYYKGIGLTGLQMGMLSALPLVVTSATSLLWGVVADRWRLHRTILRTALFLTPICVFFISRTVEFPLLIVIVVAQALVGTPISPLIDSAALEAVPEGAAAGYGKQRVWGTIGWIVSTLLVGKLTQSLGILWLFYAYIALMGLTFVASFIQPSRSRFLHTPLRSAWNHIRGLRALWLSLLGFFLLAVTIGAGSNFLSLYLQGLGAEESMIGLAWSLSALTEIPVMLYSAFLLRRIGHRGLLTIGFLVYSLRWLIYSFLTTPTWVLPVQLLQGISFAAFQVGGVTYIFDRMPEGLSTTGQALFTTVAYALAPIAGALLGGLFYDTLGLASLFRLLCVLAIAGLIIFWLGQRLEQGTAMNPVQSGSGSLSNTTQGEK